MNKLITRNIWLQIANILFELNFIQESKEILQEILNQSKVIKKKEKLFRFLFIIFSLFKTYDDQVCEKRAFILLGEIALHEHRFDQAMDLAMQGQVKEIN